MGEIADTMRSALRELAQADARLYRGLAEELGDGATAVEEPRALIQPEGGAPATSAQLMALKGPELQELCAQRGIKVAKRARKDVMVGLLLADPNGSFCGTAHWPPICRRPCRRRHVPAPASSELAQLAPQLEGIAGMLVVEQQHRTGQQQQAKHGQAGPGAHLPATRAHAAADLPHGCADIRAWIFSLLGKRSPRRQAFRRLRAQGGIRGGNQEQSRGPDTETTRHRDHQTPTPAGGHQRTDHHGLPGAGVPGAGGRCSLRRAWRDRKVHPEGMQRGRFLAVRTRQTRRAGPVTAGLVAVLLLLAGCQLPAAPGRSRSAPATPARPVRSVGALGRLVPQGAVRRLAGPVSNGRFNTRVAQVLVEEGAAVSRGQLLVVMDSHAPLKAQERRLQRQVEQLRRQLTLRRRLEQRFEAIGSQQAYPLADLEQQRLRLLELETALGDAEEQLSQVRSDLPNTVIRSPIEGVVLRLRARAGERPAEDGVLEVGAIRHMRAELEVVEGDIGRVRPGQPVQLRSEDGAFAGSLQGWVVEITPQVRQREVLPTTAPADVDARVVLVRVALAPADRARVWRYQGAKLIARIGP